LFFTDSRRDSPHKSLSKSSSLNQMKTNTLNQRLKCHASWVSNSWWGGGIPQEITLVQDGLGRVAFEIRTWLSVPKIDLKTTPNRAKITPPEGFMGSKSVQNLMLMPNLLSDYVGDSLNLFIFLLFCVYFGSIV
jgi:hypothetical protein